jgi:hypothetical protein
MSEVLCRRLAHECGSSDNSRICADHVGWEQYRFITRKIAPLSHEAIGRLPRDIVNGILGNAAIHMAVRNPGNRSAERLALETKANMFRGINRLLHDPYSRRPDVIFCCIILLFAMDVSLRSSAFPSFFRHRYLQPCEACGHTLKP